MNFGSKNEIEELSLLRFALSRQGVPDNSYFIGKNGDESEQQDKLCLLQSLDGGWIVLYTERGLVSQKAQLQCIRDAMTYFYWKLTRRDTPWDFRAEWEHWSSGKF